MEYKTQWRMVIYKPISTIDKVLNKRFYLSSCSIYNTKYDVHTTLKSLLSDYKYIGTKEVDDGGNEYTIFNHIDDSDSLILRRYVVNPVITESDGDRIIIYYRGFKITTGSSIIVISNGIIPNVFRHSLEEALSFVDLYKDKE